MNKAVRHRSAGRALAAATGGAAKTDPDRKGFVCHEEQHWTLPAVEQNSRASKYLAFRNVC